jgi:hypothetical protein
MGQGEYLMKKIAAAALAASLCAPGIALAQVQYEIANPSGTVRNFDIANLGPVLDELGIQWQATDQNQDGVTEIRAVRDGIIFFIVPAACIGGTSGCVGAQTFALFSAASVSQQAINAFNASYAFVSTGPAPKGYYVSRYDIADFGIARGNVESSLDSFHALLDVAQAALAGGASTVSTLGYADDLASARLNEASGRALGVEVRAPTSHAGAEHLREIEKMPELIRAFAGAAGEDAFNKIVNIPNQ